MKRSLTINGHATSISLEDEFWDELRRLAALEKCSLAALVARLDAQRWAGDEQARGLSSTLRLHVLSALKAQIADGSAD